MKKVAVIATALLGVIVIGAYVLLAGRPAGDPADPEHAPDAVPLPSDESPAAAPSDSATGENAGAVQGANAVEGESIRSGAKTEFTLFDGEIGYVDPVSIVRDRDPYSVVALLQKHHAFTGAGESLELEIESVIETSAGYSAWFAQVIGETSTPGRGSVNFESSGTVYFADGLLVDPKAAAPGNIVILQSEAEAIAYEAAVRFVEPRRGPFIESNEALIIEPEVEELRYYPTPDANSLRAEWRVAVLTYQPFDSLLVSVDAETGEVLRVESRLKHRRQQTDCPSVEFRVCDGSTATRESCNSTTLPDTTIYGQRADGTWGCVLKDEGGKIDDTRCNEAQYARHRTALANARDVMDYVCSLSGGYLEGVGRDGVIDILADAPERLVDKGAAAYEPGTKAILLGGVYRERDWRFDPATDKATVTHEAIHALTKGSGDIEEGLVYSMEALHMGGQDSRWQAGARKDGQVIYRGNKTDVVGNAMYRIYKKVGERDKVFKFALEVDKRRPSSLSAFRRALVATAMALRDEDLQEAVAIVLVDMGISNVPAGAVSLTMQRFFAAKMAAIFARDEEADSLAALAAQAIEEWLEDLGYLDRDEVMR